MREFERLLELSSLRDDGCSDRESLPLTELTQRTIDRARILSEVRYAIGIELLPYRLVGVLTDEHGRRLTDAQLRLTDMSVAAVVSAVVDLADHLMDTEPGAARIALCLQLGGPVDTTTGTVLFYHKSPPVAGPPEMEFTWENEQLGQMLEQSTGLPSLVENDGSALAAFQNWFGAGREANCFAVMLMREGIGGAVVRDHRLSLDPAEIGQVMLQDYGRPCDCGREGCVEATAGIRGILAEIHSHTGRILGGIVSAVELAQQDSDFGAKALDAMIQGGRAIAHAIGTMLNMYRAERLVLYVPSVLAERGTRAADAFLEEALKFQPYAHRVFWDRRIVVEPLGPYDGAHGAALIALERRFGVLPETAVLDLQPPR